MNYEEGWHDPVAEPVMSAIKDAPVHWDVTRIALIEALAAIPIGGFLTLEARAGWADAILAQLPEATAAGFYMEGVKAGQEGMRTGLYALIMGPVWNWAVSMVPGANSTYGVDVAGKCAWLVEHWPDIDSAELDRIKADGGPLATLAAEFDRLAGETSEEAEAHNAAGDDDAGYMAAGARDTWRAAASRVRRAARQPGRAP